MAIASLPWYDLREVRRHTDDLWQAIAAQFRREGIHFTPTRLERELDHREQWLHPGLVFTQCCGYDVAVDHARFLRVVATPCYDLPGCVGPTYSSFILVREADQAREVADLRGYRVAINNVSSHSGNNALRALIAPLAREGRFFSSVSVSGAHAESLRRLVGGEVDAICVDCVTFGLLARYRPEAVRGVRCVAVTPQAPAPPWVTSARYGMVFARKLQRALARAFEDPETLAARRALHLAAVVPSDSAQYAPILEFEAQSIRHGYFELPAPELSELTRLQMRAARG